MRAELLLLAGCFTARVGGGGHVTTAGGHGLHGGGALGAGVAAKGRGGYLVLDLGEADDDIDRVVAGGRVEYLDHTALPWSVALRAGGRVPVDDTMGTSRSYVGVAAGIYPLHIDLIAQPPDDDDDDTPHDVPDPDADDMLSGVLPPPKPAKPTPMDRFIDLGVELDVDAVAQGGVVFSLDLVARFDTIMHETDDQ